MPNLVHSLDASNITILVRLLHKDSNVSLLTIHDCFGCHAGDVARVQEYVRKAFVSIYCNTRMLNNFHDRCIEQIVANAGTTYYYDQASRTVTLLPLSPEPIDYSSQTRGSKRHRALPL